jgi:predicted PurR-regulated permease PerM
MMLFLKDLPKYVKYFLLVLCVLLAAKILFDYDSVAGGFGRFMSIIGPFIAGFFIAFCINLPVAWFERQLSKLKIKKFKFKFIKKHARGFSIIITIAVLIFVFVFGLSRLIPMIYENVMQLAEILPDMVTQALNSIKNLSFAADLGLDTWAESVIEENPFSMININVSDSIIVAQGFFSGIFAVFLAFVSSIYFTLEYNNVKSFIERLIMVIGNEKRRNATLKYIKLINQSFRKFLSCQLLDSLILAGITTIAFLILGSPYALTLGMMLGVLNIIPYFGSIFGSAIAVFITLFTSNWETALLTAAVLLVIQQLDGNFINPKIMGNSFKLSPVLVIIGITVGGAIGGVPGMILAIPIVNVLKTALLEFIEAREEARKKKDEEKKVINGSVK